MTPLMQQYWEIKSFHPDKVLLFRMGDFFEMFFEDAKTAAPILGIALTQRNKKSQDETPMCGVPYHSIAGPINKLLSAGHKVAICDQIEDPKFAKGLVKRAVTRILTPGMVYDPETLDATQSHYLMSFDDESVSFVESTTGECFYVERKGESLNHFLTLPVAEIVISESQKNTDYDFASRTLSIHEKLVDANLPTTARRLLSYIQSLSTQGESPLRAFEKRVWQSRLRMSPLVFKHLEIFESSLGDQRGSLFAAINRTQTSAGARLLRDDLRFPLTSKIEIEKRYEQIESWRQDLISLKRTRQTLSHLGDLERRLTKIAQPTVNGRDLIAMGQSLNVAFEVLNQPNVFLKLKNLADKIEKTIVEDPPLSIKHGRLIQTGVSAVLDELIELSTNSQGLLQAMEEREKTQTGISSLKIRYNNVFGYYIEITNTHKEKAPAHYKRKQTLANAERFYTDELIDLEKKVLSAQTRRQEVEQQVFDDLKSEILSLSSLILEIAGVCSRLDVTTSLAWLSLEQNYIRPQLETDSIKIESSRHPVVEQSLKTPFVVNHIHLNKESCLLLTGPNMAGKSTLMRQIALTIIMAQMGSYIPATQANLPIFLSLHTRIGASDILSQGLSTFMVEMKETAEMLTEAGPRSLVILDEIGRGTSTYDGMSLAQAILEHLMTQTKSYSLFATHYHELTNLNLKFPQITNAHMSVQEKNGEIRFLHTLTLGPATKSYGIHVAKLAGLPASLTKRAQQLLKEKEKSSLENQNIDQLSLLEFESELDDSNHETQSLENQSLVALVEKIREFSLDSSTPIQTMMEVSKWKEEVKNLSLN